MKIGFLEALFLLLLALKLLDKVDLEWWQVFAPIWVPLVMTIGGAICRICFEAWKGRKR